jgi:hypothetical protein
MDNLGLGKRMKNNQQSFNIERRPSQEMKILIYVFI